MHRIPRLAIGLFISLFCISTTGAAVAPKVDPADYKHYRELLDQLYELQNPEVSDWAIAKTRRMYQILQELQSMKDKGFILDKTDALLKIQNRLVENMHTHCLVLAAANTPGTVLLRVGKTPDHPEFGGLLAMKVSDFDMTMVGKNATKARDLHLGLLKERYGENFAEMTMTGIANADATIAAWTVDDVREAYASAVLDPEMHRTYSGLSFVEDYMIDVGELSYVDEKTGQLITKKLADPEFNKDRKKFAAYANELFEAVGHKTRFGMRKDGFCLGLATDISNQLWMNVEKEANKANPQNVVKKYLERDVQQIQKRMGLDIREAGGGKLYKEIEELIAKCDSHESGAWELLRAKTVQFEDEVFKMVGREQTHWYQQVLAAGDSAAARAVILDAEGAFQNLKMAKRAAPIEVMGEVGQKAAGKIARDPLFIDPSEIRPWMNRVVCSDARLFKLMKTGANVVIQVGPAMYAIYDAKDREAHGERGAYEATIKNEALGLFFQGCPLVAQSLGFDKLAKALGPAGLAWGLMDSAYTAYDLWVAHMAETMLVEPTILPRLAGISNEGHSIPDPDIITTLGVPITQEDLDAPAKYPTGTYDGGEMIVERNATGDIVQKHLAPYFKTTEEYRTIIQYNRERLLKLNEEQRRDDPPLPFPDTAWLTTTLTRGEIIAQRRLDRIFDLLRKEYISAHPNGGGEKITVLDTSKLREPFNLAEAVNFESPVSLDEILFYFDRFNKAAIKCGAELHTTTSVLREAGLEAEKKLSDGAARKFLTTLARLAAHNDRARAFYLSADPLTLESHLRSGIKVHFDGRDVPLQEIQERIDTLRAAALAAAPSQNQQWQKWLKEHWDIQKDAQQPDYCIASLDAVPDGPSRYRIVCHFQRNPEKAILNLHYVDNGKVSTSPLRPDLSDAEFRKNAQAKGPTLLVWSVPRDITGKDDKYILRVTDTTGQTVLNEAPPIIIPAIKKQWVFQGLTQIDGKPSYSKKLNYGAETWTMTTKIDGGAVRLLARRENPKSGVWSQSEAWFGPMPGALNNSGPTGAWVQLIKTSHSITEKDADGDSHTRGVPATSLGVSFSTCNDGRNFYSVGNGGVIDLHSHKLDEDVKEAKELGLHALRSADGEDGRLEGNLFSFYAPLGSPLEIKFRGKLTVLNEHFNSSPEWPGVEFEWTYRLNDGDKTAAAPTGPAASIDTAPVQENRHR